MCGPYVPPDATNILSQKKSSGFLTQRLSLDIALGNVLWKIDPAFVLDITANQVKALGAPTKRMRLTEGEGLKTGHRVMPVDFPRQKLSREVCLADFGLLLPADKTTVQYKLQGTPEYLAPERFHGCDPSPASDMWSFMAIFVYLYLGKMAFPDVSLIGGSPEVYLYRIWENLGSLPAKWKTPTTPEYGIFYASQSEALGPDPPKTRFPSRLHEDWTKDVTTRLENCSAMAETSKDAEVVRTVKRLKEELKVKKEAETHALKVIHSVFRYEPSHRLTAEQLLADPDWIKLMKLCSV
jgi:serine/threonine protein kinase